MFGEVELVQRDIEADTAVGRGTRGRCAANSE